MTAEPTLPMTSTLTTDSQRYQTVEQKRAAVHQRLLATPNDTRMRQALMTLCPAPHISRASRDGVFISYDRADELFAFDLASDLRTGGVDVWLDMMDVSYDDEGDWGTEITQALDRCGVLLMVVSHAALADADLQQERMSFIRQGKIVLPLVYQPGAYDLRAYLPPVEMGQNYAVTMRMLVKLLARA
ncbi:MAG: toll/interleukin-1 receptor domain-containing protein [Armatimonadetes bacterium]|nr:toll/interleukin-1 receptor domain-containing protein [Anaerolineae bacterium]